MTFTAPSTQLTLPAPPDVIIPPDYEFSNENAKQLYYIFEREELKYTI